MKSDFINIYAGIGEKSQKEFKQYIYCFYGSYEQVLATFEEAASLVAKNDEKAIMAFREKTQIKKDLKENAHKKLKNDYADLKKWLFEYLALQEIRGGNFESKFLTLESLRKHKQFEAVEQLSKQVQRHLDDDESPNLWHFLWKLRLSHNSYFHTSLDKLQNYQEDLSKLLSNLDDFYISAKLKYSAEVFSRSNIRQELYDILLLEPILELLKSYAKFNPLIDDLYLPMLELSKDHLSTSYSKLKSFLIKKTNHNALERSAILLYLLNYTTTRLRKGDQSMIAESFELYQTGINQSLFTITGYFLSNTFLNITNTACQLGESEWGKKFIDSHANYLNPLERDEVRILATARLLFEDKKYRDVLELINPLTYKNFNFKLNIWTLKLRASFEINETPDKLLKANNHFYKFVVTNKEIGNAFKNSILSFIKIYRQLVNYKAKQSSNLKSKQKLIKELDSIPSSTLCYDWIKKKIEMLLI